MARAALPGRLTWRLGTVAELVPETARVTSLVLDLPGWPGHRAGQHVDVRLTAEDGYQAQRSYSIASAPEDEHVVLTVERLQDGEVSPYLVDVLRAGDELELRGPIGGYFVWEESLGGPLVLIGGGSGVVPLRSMLRHWVTTSRAVPVRLLYSSRSWNEVIYRDELVGYSAAHARAGVRFALTREWPQGFTGHTGRITRELLADVAGAPDGRPIIYVCGPTGFVEAAAEWLVELGHAPGRIRTERFGPTGS
ncbi:MAG: ferredoxin reductase [Solirubrobacterales bacterium]|nr:ferredoxin reductase [Solirubrobacterales bacterium]